MQNYGTWVDETLALAAELAIMAETQVALQAIVTAELLSEQETTCLELTHYETAEDSWKKLSEQYKETDPDGLIVLGLSLAAAVKTRADYRRFGISDHIFLDTMACFPRFLSEDYTQAKKICFTRGFWVWRQLSCRLFRLGALEFEYRKSSDMGEKLLEYTKGQMILSVHIPSDARMTDEALRDSYDQALGFFREQEQNCCPEGFPVAMFCSTWLLSPTLNEILPEYSRIKRFSSDYTIYDVAPDNDGFYFWLFDGKKEMAELPRGSSLQRKVVEHLEAGGKIGSASGVILIEA